MTNKSVKTMDEIDTIKNFVSSHLEHIEKIILKENGLTEKDNLTINHLIKCLASNDDDIRFYSAALLSEFKEESINYIIEFIKNNNDEDLIYYGVFALSVLKSSDDRVIDCLLECTQLEKIGFSAISALGYTSSQKAVDSLIGYLQSPNVYKRFYSAEALGRIGDTFALKFLIKRYYIEKDNNVRYYIIRGISDIGGETIYDCILDALSDESEEVSNLAYTILLNAGKIILPKVLNYLREDSYSPNIKLKLVDFIGSLGDNSLVPELFKLLKYRDKNLIFYIIKSLKNFDNDLIKKELFSRLDNDKNSYIIFNLLRIYAEFKELEIPKHLKKYLIGLTEHTDPFVKYYAVIVLGRIKDNDIFSKFKDILYSGHYWQRMKVVSLLTEYGDAAITPLLAILKKEKNDLSIKRVIIKNIKNLKPNKDIIDELYKISLENTIELSYCAIASIFLIDSKTNTNYSDELIKMATETKSSRRKFIIDNTNFFKRGVKIWKKQKT